jgi:RNA polymerase sigma-70 factor (ECF subfamily)
MAIPEVESGTLERRVREGDRSALATLFGAHEGRLLRWVELRLDPRLKGRLAPDDVVQDVYLAAERRLEHFTRLTDLPFSVWVRLLAGQCLVDAHRRHLGAVARDAGREVGIFEPGPTTSAANLAARLAGDLTSPSEAAIRKETHQLLLEAVEAMHPLDREVLALRHFDELSNDDVARLLEISKGTASKRYVRALGRLRTALEQIGGLVDVVK